jgi:hypothetical protein
LELLEAQMRRSWHNIVTLDESWFDFNTDYERILDLQGIAPPEREGLIIQSKKFMAEIVWNLTHFFWIAALRKGETFNADYHRGCTKSVRLRPSSRKLD